MSAPLRAQSLVIAAALAAAMLTSCGTCPWAAASEIQGEPRASIVLTAEQAARKFFDAYKRHDRVAASKVASPKAINKLQWDAKAGAGATLELQETDQGDWVILDDGGFIELIIHGDGHVGSKVTDVKFNVD